MRTSLSLLVLIAASTVLLAQQPPRATQPPAPIEEADPAPAQPAPDQPESQQSAAAQEVNVDQNCRILVQDRHNAAGNYSHPHYRQDDSICRLESIHHTILHEENLDSGVVKRTRVEVNEATFVLRDISPDPVAFIVHQPIFHGGHIDSDPQPTSIEGNVAIFRVYAKPGQTIRLHVGERR